MDANGDSVMEEFGIQFKSVFGVGLSYAIGDQRQK